MSYFELYDTTIYAIAKKNALNIAIKAPKGSTPSPWNKKDGYITIIHPTKLDTKDIIVKLLTFSLCNFADSIMRKIGLVLYRTTYVETGMNFKDPVEQNEEMNPNTAHRRTQFIYVLEVILNTDTPLYRPILYMNRAEKLCLTNYEVKTPTL